ncbi:MAG: DNA polymerase III subunit [Candidatus Marinimicrobia bacterium]|nr:DNA polymerase III subunit [Candidatus Neomarinimicrobiota bacterium]
MIYELIGQQTIAGRFQRLIGSQRIGSAYLFAGPEGAGKASMALNLASLLLCQDPKNKQACGECASCAKMKHLNHPNLHLIHAMPRGKNPSDNDPYAGLSEADFTAMQDERDALTRDPYRGINIPGANQILISSIRHIKRELAMKPAESGRQVVLVFQVEMANTASFNSFLKILEEPPARTTIILTTSALEAVPPTIRSRCQIVKFNPVPDIQLVEYLVSQGQDDSNAQRIARLSAGNVQHAKTLMEADFSEVDATILDFWRIMMGGKVSGQWVTTADITQVIESYTSMAKSDPAGFRNLLRFMVFWLRDAQLLASSPEAKDQLINTHLITELINFIKYYPKFPYFEMIRKIESTLRDSNYNMYMPALLADLFLDLRSALLEVRKVPNAT